MTAESPFMHYTGLCAMYLNSKSIIVTYLASLWLPGFVTEPLQVVSSCASLQVFFFILIYIVNLLITLGDCKDVVFVPRQKH